MRGSARKPAPLLILGQARRLSGIRKWSFMKWWFSNGSKMHTSTYLCENSSHFAPT